MKKSIATIAAAAALVVALAGPVAAAPGTAVRQACGTSFGGLVSAGKSAGGATHANYAGGAAAFSDPAILAAHGCTG